MYDLVLHAGARSIDASDNTHPDYSSHLTSAQAWNLIKFMLEEWVAASDLYDIEVKGPQMYVDYTQDPPVVMAPTITFSNVGAKGSAISGEAVYDGKCQVCMARMVRPSTSKAGVWGSSSARSLTRHGSRRSSGRRVKAWPQGW
jgi:hypothetical protein